MTRPLMGKQAALEDGQQGVRQVAFCQSSCGAALGRVLISDIFSRTAYAGQCVIV